MNDMIMLLTRCHWRKDLNCFIKRVKGILLIILLKYNFLVFIEILALIQFALFIARI